MKVYVLQVVDFEDGYEYDTLIYHDLDEYNKAYKLIEDFDSHYYDDDYESESGSYYEDLRSLLEQHDLYKVATEYTTITVR